MAKQPFDLEERLLDYSAEAIRLTQYLPRDQVGTHIAGQLIRSATPPLANHGESQASESVNDFIHKFKLCLKELRETRRWIRLIQRVPLAKTPSQFDHLLLETEELIRIFYTSIQTARDSKKKKDCHA